MDSGGSSDMTLAFELDALKALADPNNVFNDARQWTSYVGVVSDQPTYVVTNFTRKERIRQDFFSGPRGVEESLENVKRQFDTERHVFVGISEEHEAQAEETGWEYLPLEQAAEAAGWELADDEAEADPFEGSESRDDWP
jgi:FAD/FMN-containing dehydrogenase